MANIGNELHSDQQQVTTFTSAVEAGLWGLALKALDAGEGPGAGSALLASVKAGRGAVVCTSRFDQHGVVHEGHFCSHGARSHLFTVRVNYPAGAAPVGGDE